MYRRIYRLIKTEMNTVLIFHGDTGKGKSTGALRCSEDLDRNFSVERIVFDSNQFFKLVKEGDSKGKLGFGSVIIFDEAAGSDEAVDARNALSKVNRAMGQFTTISRAKRLIIIYCSPMKEQLDKRVRLIGVTATFKFLGVNLREKRSYAEIRWSYLGTGKFIEPNPRFKKKGEDRLWKVQYARIPLPSKELIKAYKKKKNENIDSQIDIWSKESEKRALKKEKKEQTFKSSVDEAMKIKDKLINKEGKALLPLICYYLGVGRHKGRMIKDFLEARYSALPPL